MFVLNILKATIYRMNIFANFNSAYFALFVFLFIRLIAKQNKLFRSLYD
jgi:hypothetical protein